MASLITVVYLFVSILTGQLGTQIPHVEILVDLFCEVSEKLSIAEIETVLYSKYLGSANSKSSGVLFYSHLWHRKKNTYNQFW